MSWPSPWLLPVPCRCWQSPGSPDRARSRHGRHFVYLARGYPYGPVFTAFMVAAIVNIVMGHRVAVWWAVGAAVVLSGVVRVSASTNRCPGGGALGSWHGRLSSSPFGELIRVRAANVIESRRPVRRGTATGGRGAAADRPRAARRRRPPHVAHQRAGGRRPAPGRPASPSRSQTALRTIKDASKEALSELRSLIGVLRAEARRPRGPRSRRSRSLDELVDANRPGRRQLSTQVADGDVGAHAGGRRARRLPDRPGGDHQRRAALRGAARARRVMATAPTRCRSDRRRRRNGA